MINRLFTRLIKRTSSPKTIDGWILAHAVIFGVVLSWFPDLVNVWMVPRAQRIPGRWHEEWTDIEVPSESFHRSSWDSRTCYPRRAFNQGLTDNSPAHARSIMDIQDSPTVSWILDLMSIMWDLLKEEKLVHEGVLEFRFSRNNRGTPSTIS